MSSPRNCRIFSETAPMLSRSLAMSGSAVSSFSLGRIAGRLHDLVDLGEIDLVGHRVTSFAGPGVATAGTLASLTTE